MFFLRVLKILSDGAVRAKVSRYPGHGLSDLGKNRHVNACRSALVDLVLAIKVRPASVEPVGLVRLVAPAGFEFLVKMLAETGSQLLDFGGGHQPVANQAISVQRQGGLVLIDPRVHDRLGEARFVALVVAESAVAEYVDDHVLAEFLTKLRRDPCGMDNGLRIVAVDVEDRRFHHQGDVGRVGRGTRIPRRRRETDLVVDHDVDGSAGLVAREARRGRSTPQRPLAPRRPRRRAAESA